jgi:DivIVA domain-containing protein
MDTDDPEKRIAELERRLAEARGASNPNTAGITPEQVRDVAFSKPPIGKRGYNEDEVDAFLDLVQTALRDPARHPHTGPRYRRFTSDDGVSTKGLPADQGTRPPRGRAARAGSTFAA